MAEGRNLQTLTPEIQLQLLFQIDTPADLYALIQASPRLLQIFLLNKQAILSAVSHGQFHEAALPDALTFAKLSQHRQPLSEKDIQWFCEVDTAQLEEWAQIGSSIPEAIAMCELSRNLQFFIEDYTRKALAILEVVGQSLDRSVLAEHRFHDLEVPSALSDSELARMQRAFCRFEVYRYLFSRCSTGVDHDNEKCLDNPVIKPKEQARLYLSKLSIFEIVEIFCVRDYLMRQLRQILDDLENEMMEKLMPEDFLLQQCEEIEFKTNLYPFSQYGKMRQTGLLEHLMSLGLPAIRRIFRSSGDQRRSLIVRDDLDYLQSYRHFYAEDYFLTEALNKYRPFDYTQPVPEDCLSSKLLSDPQAPAAWSWAHPSTPISIICNGGYGGLRDFGYVFWDFDTLQESGIFGRDSEDVEIRISKFSEFYGDHRDSVEERLLQRYNMPEAVPAATYFDREGYVIEDWDKYVKLGEQEKACGNLFYHDPYRYEYEAQRWPDPSSWFCPGSEMKQDPRNPSNLWGILDSRYTSRRFS